MWDRLMSSVSLTSDRGRRRQYNAGSSPDQQNNMNGNTERNNENYTSQDELVEIKTTQTARRWPPHNYPCVVVRLKPQQGTRVLALENGGIEWMPRWSELTRLILQMGLQVSEAIPPDKPEARRLFWQRRNALRHRRPKQ